MNKMNLEKVLQFMEDFLFCRNIGTIVNNQLFKGISR